MPIHCLPCAGRSECEDMIEPSGCFGRKAEFGGGLLVEVRGIDPELALEERRALAIRRSIAVHVAEHRAAQHPVLRLELRRRHSQLFEPQPNLARSLREKRSKLGAM